MTTENTVSPDVDTQIPAPVAVETPELAAPEAEGNEPQEGDKPPLSDAEKEAKALRRRIGRLTQQKYQLSAELDQRRSQHAEQTAQANEPMSKEQLDALINQRAKELTQAQVTGQKLYAVETELKKAVGPAYDDFIEDLESAGPAASSFVKTVMELDYAAKVMGHFVTDRDELDRVLQMSPINQAAYMGRLSAQLENKPSVSTAPRPLTPLNSRAPRTNSPPASDEDMVRQIRASRA